MKLAEAFLALKNIGTIALVVCVALGLSYCAELPKYQFTSEAHAIAARIPGARLISSFKSGDLASPVSWFWPATTTLNYAQPDPLLNDRFTLITFVYDHAPIIFLVDVDCKMRRASWYDQDEPENAIPARNLWGEKIKATNGKVYRLWKADHPLPDSDVHALCSTDWKHEREAVANSRGL